MGFYEKAKAIISKEKVLTDNGAVAYRTSGHELLDFNFDVSAMRGMDEKEIMDKFAKVYYENKEVAILYLFYLGDIREGLGERHAFRSCMEFLCIEHEDIAKDVIQLIPHYNRWDSLVELLTFDHTNISEEVIQIIREQLTEDIENYNSKGSVSLLAKWLPSVNTSSIESKKLARLICDKLCMSEKNYRKTLSMLREYIRVVERDMSANRWDEINYEHVPSKANLLYKKAFLRHDAVRRIDYLNRLAVGKVKVNASVVNPAEIVCKYHINPWEHFAELDVLLEGMWKSLPSHGCKNTLVVRDGSGSMMARVPKTKTLTCLDVATALAIYMAEHNTGEWKDKFITFSSRPEVVDMQNCEALRDKLLLSYRYNDCSHTDVYKTMHLILDTAVENNLKQEEMPEMIVIVSDMQFDPWRHNFNKSLFDHISEEFAESGYKLPKICFWNVDSEPDKGVPMQNNENGVILCSGFSTNIMNMFMSGKTDPYEVLLDTLYSERYKPVLDVLNR